MFTGIIEEIGHVNNVKKGTASAILTIQAEKVLEGTHIGDSIAVNGVCLTVTGIYDNTFTADVMHETLNRSSLGKLVSGSAVNLERAMAADGRFGGHIVSGHIDGTGKVAAITKDDNAIWYQIKTDSLLPSHTCLFFNCFYMSDFFNNSCKHFKLHLLSEYHPQAWLLYNP